MRGYPVREQRIGYAAAIAACIALTACGNTVAGHTYHDNGGVVAIEFQSGGKAFVSAGPVTQACSYTENGKSIRLTCESDTTDFTLEDDGALSGPPNGMMARLTPLKK
jgi:hypothetical protein